MLRFEAKQLRMTPEARARLIIDRPLTGAGWQVQDWRGSMLCKVLCSDIPWPTSTAE
jgi:hypothetical protein